MKTTIGLRAAAVRATTTDPHRLLDYGARGFRRALLRLHFALVIPARFRPLIDDMRDDDVERYFAMDRKQRIYSLERRAWQARNGRAIQPHPKSRGRIR